MRGPDDRWIEIRCHHQPAACIRDPPDIGGLEHGSSTDEGTLAEPAGESLDAAQRIGRVQRHLDDTEPDLDQHPADIDGFLRAHAAKDGHQWQLSHGGPQTLTRALECHALTPRASAMARRPSTAASGGPERASMPARCKAR